MSEERLREIGRALRELRTGVGWSGSEVAKRARVTQPTVSRVENGQRVSGPDAVERMIAVLPVDPADAERLRSEVTEVYAASAERRVDAGYSLAPGSVRRYARAARVVCAFQSAMVPRLLHTEEYAAAAGARGSLDRGVLDDPGREFRFVVTEGALRTWPGSGAKMAAQVDHVVSLERGANVTLSVLPWSARVPVLPPHGFTLYDQAAVSVETFTAEMTITDPDDVSAYAVAFAALEEAAVTGAGMRELLAEVKADFLKLDPLIQ